VTCCYPGIGGKPMILVCVQCLLSGNAWHTPMLLDTGADSSCFPAAFAKGFGHDNEHPDVEIQTDAVQGIGGCSDAYIHSVRIGLIHPSKSSREKTVLAWSSKIDKVQFVQKMECKHGLLGMDVMNQWKEIRFQPIKSGLLIRITI
jgi:hypothetical protein